jgi:hypothetical protein
MRDHPLGVGWNNAVKIYGEKYSPPEGSPAALTMNDYLMLGTELGIPALLCLVAYVGLCYRKSPNHAGNRLLYAQEQQKDIGVFLQDLTTLKRTRVREMETAEIEGKKVFRLVG